MATVAMAIPMIMALDTSKDPSKYCLAGTVVVPVGVAV